MPNVNTKTRINGKTFYFLEQLPNPDETLIKWMWKVKNTKNEEFTLIYTYKKYTLYDTNKRRVAQVNHITEIEK